MYLYQGANAELSKTASNLQEQVVSLQVCICTITEDLHGVLLC